ncbi:heterogeneous nuclear ribonucleoprotein L-like isoform X2 [Arctopsyche grandis]|uniref:heterogeneous nuclear ribonucleoprotein L-like isoform X2 n=1 Tax=Arctopsyche grandis TaxID=121162 RepID=UPI00406D7EB5
MAYNGGAGKRLAHPPPNNHELDMDRSNGGSYGEPKRKRHDPPARPNHILLYTIVNPAYPITVDVIHTISTPHGQVQRIVVFKKNGVQAMVEFDSLESATRAKEALNGADIYSGCCTLKIEFAKPERLNVFKNDKDSWDYTRDGIRRYPVDHYSYGENAEDDQGAVSCEGGGLLGDDLDYGGGMNQVPGLLKDGRGHRGMPHHQGGLHHGGGPGVHHVGGGGGAPPPPPLPPHHHGCVMMVYGLDPATANTDRLFNLVCLYGNVARIKFLKTKEGTAMVQMGDSLSVERCVQNLNNVTVNDHTMTLAFSKQSFLSEVINPYPLTDKSPSFKEYVGNKNNRFLTAASIHKNRIQPPSKIIHFFNTPPDVSEEQLLQVFADYNVTPPTQISKFPLKSDRSSSGLMEFANISQAVTAIMACNHATIMHPGAKFPFLMKLCFSSARAIGPIPGGGRRSPNSDNKHSISNNLSANNSMSTGNSGRLSPTKSDMDHSQDY